MGKCCIVRCGTRKNKNQPHLTFHRFPRNEALRIKWLEAIGEKNLNPRQKSWLVCSLHFEESCFNKTLDVVRLRDNSLPTIFPFTPSARRETFVICETNNIMHEVTSTSVASDLCQSPILDESASVASDLCQSLILNEEQPEVVKNETVKALRLRRKCVKLKKRIKFLKEKLRRKNKNIANLKYIIKDLRQKNLIDNEQDQAYLIVVGEPKRGFQE